MTENKKAKANSLTVRFFYKIFYGKQIGIVFPKSWLGGGENFILPEKFAKDDKGCFFAFLEEKAHIFSPIWQNCEKKREVAAVRGDMMKEEDKKIIDFNRARREDSLYFSERVAEEDVLKPVGYSRWKWWLILLICCPVLIGLVLFTTAEEAVDESNAVPADVVKTEEQIYQATYVERLLKYEDCGHTESDLLHGDARFVGKTFSQLEAEGWRVAKVDTNKVRIYREARGLCEADQSKRTVRLTEKGIAVYEGPKDAIGSLLTEMPLEKTALPAEIRNQLAGEGMEFANEEELWETLDSLDEFISEETSAEENSAI